MPDSELGWSLMFSFFGYMCGIFAMTPMVLMVILQSLETYKRISNFSKTVLALINWFVTLVIFAGVVGFLLEAAGREEQQSDLNLILFSVLCVTGVSLSIFAYAMYEKRLLPENSGD